MDKRKMRRVVIDEADYQKLVAAAAKAGFIPAISERRTDTAKEGVEKLLHNSIHILEDYAAAWTRGKSED